MASMHNGQSEIKGSRLLKVDEVFIGDALHHSAPLNAGDEIITDEDVAALREAANSPIPMCVVQGFTPGAVSLFVTDPVLATKSIMWIVSRAKWNDACAIWSAYPTLRGRLWVGQADSSDAVFSYLEPALACVVILKGACVEKAEILRWFALYMRQRCLVSVQFFQTLDTMLRRSSVLSQTIPFQSLRDHCQGMPAICVAAGPSLDRRLDMLRRLQGRSLIIAVDLVATHLQQAGITPDIIFTIDSSPIIATRLKGFDASQSILVQSLSSSPELDRMFARRVYVDPSSLGERLLGIGGKINFLANVGVSSVLLAESLGCPEILLMGLDLAMEGDQLYAHVVADRDEHTAQQRGVFAAQNLYCQIVGNNGCILTGNIKFESSLKMLQIHLAKQISAKIYNANLLDGTGARIQGTLSPPDGWLENGSNDQYALIKTNLCTLWDESPRLASCDEALLRNDVVRDVNIQSQQLCDAMLTGSNIFIHPRTRSADDNKYATSHGLENFWMSSVVMIAERQIQFDTNPMSDEIIRLRSLGADLVRQGASFSCKLLSSSFSFHDIYGSSPAAQAFLRAIHLSGDMNQVSTTQELLLNLQCHHFQNVRLCLPQFPFPDPSDAITGLRMACYWKEVVSDDYLERCVLLAWVEGVSELQALPSIAITCGLMAANIFDLRSDDNPAWSCAVQATRSLFRLKESGPEVVADLLTKAWSWTPIREATIRIVAERRDHGAALNQLIRNPPCPLEPRQEALVILHHPHPERLRDFVTRAEGLSDIAAVSAAQRLLEAGRAQEALSFLGHIRQLSIHYDQSQALICTAWMALNNMEQALAAQSRISNPELRLRYFLSIQLQFQGPVIAARSVIQQAYLPALDQLAQVAVGIIQLRASEEAQGLVAWLESGEEAWKNHPGAGEITTILQGLRKVMRTTAQG